MPFGCSDQRPPQTPTAATEVKTGIEARGGGRGNRQRKRQKSSSDGDVALEVASANGLNNLSPEEIADGWIKLFDGHTLFGWKSNSKLTWSVKDGIITADSDVAENRGLLVTTTRFADYELRCDYKVAVGGNSGIFLRTPFEPKDPAVDCYELNMCDSHPEFGTASLVKRVKPDKAVKGDGEWHSFHVRLEGPKVTVKFDGEQVLEFTDTTEKPLTTGFIGLQMNGGKIEFRNVFLKPVGMKSLFDGNSLAGWRQVPGSKSQFEVKDGTIHVTNGRGFLETESVAGNFVFQFDAICNGDSLNSGIFFRAMEGTEQNPSHGYEFQIHNGLKEGNRTKPVDHGTGAIFRRVSARRVVSNDREWFTGTLVADGAHFSTWINGIQVVDWTDERPDNENPREGRRLAAGHFSLQGHDPTTDLAFRHLKVWWKRRNSIDRSPEFRNRAAHDSPFTTIIRKTPRLLSRMMPARTGTISRSGSFAPNETKLRPRCPNGKPCASAPPRSSCIPCRGWRTIWKSSNAMPPNRFKAPSSIGRGLPPSTTRSCWTLFSGIRRRRW